MLGARALSGRVPVSSSLGGPVGALPARYTHTEQAHSLSLSPVRRSSWHGMVTLLVYTPDQKVHMHRPYSPTVFLDFFGVFVLPSSPALFLHDAHPPVLSASTLTFLCSIIIIIIPHTSEQGIHTHTFSPIPPHTTH